MLLAGLAGIGAAFLSAAVARGITLELWFLGVLVTDGPAPRIDELLLPAFLVGSLVAARLGGVRAVGVLALYVVGSVSLVIMRAVVRKTCSSSPRTALRAFSRAWSSCASAASRWTRSCLVQCSQPLSFPRRSTSWRWFLGMGF